jgi:hypothetical protein
VAGEARKVLHKIAVKHFKIPLADRPTIFRVEGYSPPKMLLILGINIRYFFFIFFFKSHMVGHAVT